MATKSILDIDINDARFRKTYIDGQLTGHDNFNYAVTTWEHRFSKDIITKTEAYYMWQRDAEIGGTPSAGPVKPFGGGGGDGTLLPGLSEAFGVLNYTEMAFTKNDYITVRNEWWKDERGMRTGFPGTYTSHAIGLTHNFTPELQVRPEITRLAQGFAGADHVFAPPTPPPPRQANVR